LLVDTPITIESFGLLKLLVSKHAICEAVSASSWSVMVLLVMMAILKTHLNPFFIFAKNMLKLMTVIK
jgi:hypothetical protein